VQISSLISFFLFIYLLIYHFCIYSHGYTLLGPPPHPHFLSEDPEAELGLEHPQLISNNNCNFLSVYFPSYIICFLIKDIFHYFIFIPIFFC
jgi:hypothetical protein